MRSRYTAYVLKKYDYLQDTWHPDACPENLGGTTLRWINLRIVRTHKGQPNDQQGSVEFIASFCDGNKGKSLHETSRFIRSELSSSPEKNNLEKNGRWLYLDGQCKVSDIGRNEPCPCGSGKKFKRCCGSMN